MAHKSAGFIIPGFGINYNLNNRTRLTLEASLESINSQNINSGPFSFEEEIMTRGTTVMQFIRIGVQQDLFLGGGFDNYE